MTARCGVSAVNAVRYAVALQRGMAEHNAAIPPEQRIEFRAGRPGIDVPAVFPGAARAHQREVPGAVRAHQGGTAQGGHAPRGRVAGAGKERGERERRHHAQTEEDRRGRRGGKAVERVEDAAVERDQGHRQQVGKGDAGERDREREEAGVALETGREQADHRRRERDREREQHHLGRDQQGEDAVGEQARRIRPALGADARIGRHEGGAERALGEDGAEVIGQAERHQEGIGHRPGAEHRGHHHVAQEPGEPRHQGVAADGEDAIDHAGCRPVALRAMERVVAESRRILGGAAASGYRARTRQNLSRQISD